MSEPHSKHRTFATFTKNSLHLRKAGVSDVVDLIKNSKAYGIPLRDPIFGLQKTESEWRIPTREFSLNLNRFFALGCLERV